MSHEQLADLTQPQRDRLAFVELRVRFIGEIRRQGLVLRFGVRSLSATRDLALYGVKNAMLVPGYRSPSKDHGEVRHDCKPVKKTELSQV